MVEPQCCDVASVFVATPSKMTKAGRDAPRLSESFDRSEKFPWSSSSDRCSGDTKCAIPIPNARSIVGDAMDVAMKDEVSA